MLYVRKRGGSQMPKLQAAAQGYREARQTILKGKTENGVPEDDVQDWHDPKSLWDYLGEDVTNIVLDQLIREQGGLCAYCMKPIERVKAGNKTADKEAMPAHVEHFIPRHPKSKDYPSRDYQEMQWQNEGEADEYSPYADEQSVNYRNLIAVCDQKQFNGEATCDASRGSECLHHNPCNRDDVRHFEYSTSGTVKAADDAKHDDTVSDIATLNLNASRLKDSRKTQAAAMLKTIYKDHPDAASRIAYCKSKLAEFQHARKKPEYYEMKVYLLCKGMGDLSRYPVA